MKCQFCKNEISSEDLFCGECGQRVEQTLPRPIASSANIQKVSPPTPVIPPAQDKPVPSKATDASKLQAPARFQTRRLLRAFFLGGAVLSGLGLAGLLVSLMVPDVVNGAVFFLVPLALSFFALILATVIKRVSIRSALFSIVGAITAFTGMGLLFASGPEPELGVIVIVYSAAFLTFIIPAFLFRKG